MPAVFRISPQQAAVVSLNLLDVGGNMASAKRGDVPLTTRDLFFFFYLRWLILATLLADGD